MIGDILQGSEVLNPELKPLNTTVNRSGSSSSSRSDSGGSAQKSTYTVATPSGTATNLTKEQYDKVKQAIADYNTARNITSAYKLSEPSWSAFNGSNGQVIIDAIIKEVVRTGNTPSTLAYRSYVAQRAKALNLVDPAIEDEVRRLAKEYNIEFNDNIREKIYSGQADEVLASFRQKAQEIADITARTNAKFAAGTYTAPSHAVTSTAPSPAAATAVSPSTSDGSNSSILWLLLGAAVIGLGLMLTKSNSKKRK